LEEQVAAAGDDRLVADLVDLCRAQHKLTRLGTRCF
jgi:hypothetical protein